MRLIPAQNIRSMSGFNWERDVLKCSFNQVNDSHEVNGLPVICAADGAYFNIDRSL